MGPMRAWRLALISVSLAAAATAGADKPAEPEAKTAFDVLEYQIEGNSVLSNLAIERAVYPFLGPGERIEDVEKARAALEQAYRDAGYSTVVVDIPVQKVDDGVVRLAVTEGRVDRLRIIGSRYYAQGAIRERVPSVAAEATPYFPEVQRELAGLNRGADRRVTPLLRPGSLPGTTEIELKVDDKLPLHGSLELSNRYSANTEPLRLGAGLRYDNFLGRDHSIGFQFQTSPQDTEQVRVYLGTYAVPLEKGAIYGYIMR